MTDLRQSRRDGGLRRPAPRVAVDTAKVARLRAAIAAGGYVVDPDAVAVALLAEPRFSLRRTD